ncbi:MAG: DUF1722 domain-containing protein [Gammaproteobacteria bacterium]|nr:MAG: DUF1722 domain-containing protein [Gammaproteobacteria bacterium]
MEIRPLIGISTCLLGECVRYDGGHKLDRYLRDTLGQFVDFTPVCPEVDCGMTTPREAMRLVDFDGNIRLMTQKTNVDMTPGMVSWMKEKLNDLQELPLCGFIFKSKSPSSGLFRVKVYKNGEPTNFGRGIFAQGFTDRFPLLPVEEDGRLNDSKLRENFIERIFAMHRWRQLNQNPKTIAALTNFHAKHKYSMMAHCPASLKILGNLVANHNTGDINSIYTKYFAEFITAMKNIATVQKNTNVLEHIMGYFKNQLSSDEKQELKQIIINYHNELVPLIVPITLINHFIRKYKPEYLQQQYYLNPHPKELMLRNHT